MKNFIVFLFLICLVQNVYDGDTITVLCNKETMKVRLLGINTPELKPKECYGIEARDYLRSMISGKEVKLEFEGDEPTRDFFRRTLAYVFIDNKMVNLQMLGWGYAKDYTYKYKTKRYPPEYFHLAEDYAKKSQIGLWKYCKSN